MAENWKNKIYVNHGRESVQLQRKWFEKNNNKQQNNNAHWDVRWPAGAT